MPRDQSVPELVQDDACKERDNKTYSAQDCLQAPSFQPVKDNHPQNQQKEGRVNVEIDTRKPSDSPRPAHLPYLIAKARKRGRRTATSCPESGYIFDDWAPPLLFCRSRACSRCFCNVGSA